MFIYQSKFRRLSGSNYSEVLTQATTIYSTIKKRTKRRPYIRSAYFRRDKVFCDRFWGHLWDKNWRDRTRRLRLLSCGIDLIQNSKVGPETKINENKPIELLHKFCGTTKDGELFFVQVREDRKTGQKTLMSIFPGD